MLEARCAACHVCRVERHGGTMGIEKTKKEDVVGVIVGLLQKSKGSNSCSLDSDFL